MMSVYLVFDCELTNPDHPRDVFDLELNDGLWEIDHSRILGWLWMR